MNVRADSEMSTEDEVNDNKAEGREMRHKDSKQAYIISTRLSDFTSLTVIWRIMQDLGWKYKTSGISTQYISPSGRNMGDSLKLMKVLDSLALPIVSFRPEEDALATAKDTVASWDSVDTSSSPSNTLLDIEAKHLKELKEMRDALLEKIYDEWYDIDDDSDDSDREDDSDHDKYATTHELDTKDKEHSMSSSHTRRKGSSRKSQSVTINEKGTEEYFARKKQKSKRTKGKTLIWPNPKEAVHKMKRIMKSKRSNTSTRTLHAHGSQCDEIVRKYMNNSADEWLFLLSTNHSLLLYGFGSKLKLLNEFTEYLSNVGDVVTFNGYDSQISIEKMLDMIVMHFLDGIEPPAAPQLASIKDNFPDHSIVSRAVSISRKLATYYKSPLFIVLHNIDGTALRNSVAQSAIAALTAHSQISADWNKTRVVRLIASVDHVDTTALLWDIDTMNNFSWIWKNANTLAPYFDEIEHSISDERHKMKTSQDLEMDYESMQGVLSSFAPRFQEAVAVLARLQRLSDKDVGSMYSLIEMSKWRQECMTNMIVPKETEFRTIVAELQDHGIITCHRKKEIVVCIPTQDRNLEMLEQRKNS